MFTCVNRTISGDRLWVRIWNEDGDGDKDWGPANPPLVVALTITRFKQHFWWDLWGCLLILWYATNISENWVISVVELTPPLLWQGGRAVISMWWTASHCIASYHIKSHYSLCRGCRVAAAFLVTRKSYVPSQWPDDCDRYISSKYLIRSFPPHTAHNTHSRRSHFFIYVNLSSTASNLKYVD